MFRKRGQPRPVAASPPSSAQGNVVPLDAARSAERALRRLE
jgi:hypothetical protein